MKTTYQILFLCCCLGVISAFSARVLRIQAANSLLTSISSRLYLSSFYGKFEDQDFNEDEDDEDDDEEDDEDDELDDLDVANFRTRMSSMFGGSEEDSSDGGVDELIRLATGSEAEAPKDWANVASALEPGTVLLANPTVFCPDLSPSAVPPPRSLLGKYGLTLPPPADLGPDRRADLLPVLLVTSVQKNGCQAVLLNRRTGHLLGDLESPDNTPLLEKFCIQPLWFGGIDNVSVGLDMLHQCPAVAGSKLLTKDGLYWGGDPAQAQEAMEDPSLDRVLTGFDFKFFVQCTLFGPGELEKQLDSTFYLAEVSKEVLFRSRDRMGTRRAKPLWTEICELLGGKFQTIRDQLYDD